jgi:hypothetical protein
MIADKYATVYIEPFANKIDITSQNDSPYKYRVYRPMLETAVTRGISDKFLADGNLKPVPKDSADLILKGELVEFRRDALRYTSGDDVEEYRLNLVINVEMWDARQNKLLWHERNFTGDATYFTVGSLAKSEDTAVDDAVRDLARRIVERAVEVW